MIQRCQLLLFLFLYASCVFFCPHIWAEKKAQLRRFKDGAIIHAVVWSDIENDVKRGRVQLENGAKTGDTVERITRHVIRKHFYKQDFEEMPCPQFSLRNITSLVEGAQQASNGESQMNSSDLAHKQMISTFETRRCKSTICHIL